MSFEQIIRIEEMKELNDFEQKILKEDNNNEKNFKKYGLLNNEWIKKYKNLDLKNNQINNNSRENIFKIEDLKPKFELLDLNDDEKTKISIPIDFALVSGKFIDLISKHFENGDERVRFLKLSYEELKIKNGLLIKDKEENRILYCQHWRDNNLFNIKYILKYLNQVCMNNEIEMILKKNFYNYLKERNIFIYKSCQTICFIGGEKVGYFYSLNNDFKRNGIDEITINIIKKVKENKNKKTFIMNKYLDSIFLCLYQFKDLIQGISVKNNDVFLFKSK